MAGIHSTISKPLAWRPTVAVLAFLAMWLLWVAAFVGLKAAGRPGAAIFITQDGAFLPPGPAPTWTFNLTRGNQSTTINNTNNIAMTLTLGAFGSPSLDTWVTSSPVTVPANGSATLTVNCNQPNPGTGTITPETDLATVSWSVGDASGTMTATMNYQQRQN